MHDPYFDHRFDHARVPPVLRWSSLALSLAIVAIVLLDAFVGALRSVT